MLRSEILFHVHNDNNNSKRNAFSMKDYLCESAVVLKVID